MSVLLIYAWFCSPSYDETRRIEYIDTRSDISISIVGKWMKNETALRTRLIGVYLPAYISRHRVRSLTMTSATVTISDIDHLQAYRIEANSMSIFYSSQKADKNDHSFILSITSYKQLRMYFKIKIFLPLFLVYID